MTFFCIPGPDDQNRWNRKNCPKFFHRVIFAFWIQICNPNLCKSHIFWITAYIWEMIVFCIPGPDDQNRWNRKNCPKFLHRVIFRSEFKSATQIYVYPRHFELQLILRNYLFSHYDKNWWKKKNCPKFFHGVIFVLWIQIFNPNLCKSHIFWITPNIENWPFFAYADLMTKIDEIGKIARNSIIV